MGWNNQNQVSQTIRLGNEEKHQACLSSLQQTLLFVRICQEQKLPIMSQRGGPLKKKLQFA